MILRKPFAFFIKHFKLIHLILTICAIFLAIQTGHILSFFLEYTDFMNVQTATIMSNLFHPLLLICVMIMILGSLLIFGIMKNKKKPAIFYVVNIVIYLFLAGLYLYSYYTISSLDVGFINIKTLKLLQDVFVITILFQVINIIILMVRTLGFDIKKFDFEKDIQELEITSEDNEEIEIKLEFDFDQLKTNVRKNIRHLKYAYVENKFILNIIMVIVISIFLVFVYRQIAINNRVYKEGRNFQVTGYQMNVLDTYTVTTDYSGEVIDSEAAFVIAKINLKTSQTSNPKFQKARLALKIKDHLFYHQKEYKIEFRDLGNIYQNQRISNDFQSYIFVFKIPKGYQKKKMTLAYFDPNQKIKIKIKPETFSNPKTYQYQLGDLVHFDDSMLKNMTLQITDVKIQNTFKSKYQFCLDTKHCTNSYEYLIPTYTGNKDKSLLKIVGKVEKQKEEQDLFSFMELYGSIRYTTQGKEKQMDMNLKQILPYKSQDNDTYYIEVDQELKQADHIYIDFHIRDKEYEYAVK